MWVPECIHWATQGMEPITLASSILCSTSRACVHRSTEVTLRRPATLTTECPVWCCRPPWPPSKLWRAARPARSRPAATPWPLPGPCPSSPGSGVSPSLPAGCCPWQAGWGPWRGLVGGPSWSGQLLCHAGWAFGLSHRCGDGCTGLQDGTKSGVHFVVFHWGRYKKQLIKCQESSCCHIKSDLKPEYTANPLMYLTSAVVVVLVVQVGGLGGQSGAEAVFLVDAEEDRSSFQHQVLHPVGHRGLQVLLVHQTNNQHGLCQADHQEGHANHKVYTCKKWQWIENER